MSLNVVRSLVASFFLLVGLASALHAQDRWPLRPIRVVIGFPPGGAVDALTRTLITPLSTQLGQPIVVDNRPGAGQALASEILSKADPDGYTIGILDSGPLTIGPNLRQVPYDSAKSFRPVGSIANLPMIILSSRQSNLKTLQDIEVAARAKPGALSYASTGPGSIHNLIGEYLKASLKLNIAHVPYRGIAQSLPDLLSGRVELMVASVSSSVRLVQDGQVRAVAVTSSKRSAALPGVPTLAEQGADRFDAQAWLGLFAPAGVSDAVVSQLSAALRIALRDPTLIRQEVERGGNELLQGTADELASMLARDDARWKAVIREQNVKAD